MEQTRDVRSNLTSAGGVALIAVLLLQQAHAGEGAAQGAPTPPSPLLETRGGLDQLHAAGDALADALKEVLDLLVLGAPASPDAQDGQATSYKGWSVELGCELDPSAFRSPFSDSVIIKSFDVVTSSPATAAWLVRTDTGARTPLDLHPSGAGTAAVAPAVRPGIWAVVAQGSSGPPRCVLVRAKTAPSSGPACAPGPTGTRGCEALYLVLEHRYAELRALGASLPASDTETRLILGAAACQHGHVPGDLVPGDDRDCAEVYSALHR